MGLMQLNEMGWNKIQMAIEVIKQNEPPEGYYVANSGGKDSGIIVDLCKRAGVKFDAHYCVSPIDPPEVYKFLKEHHPETQWDYYAKGFWTPTNNLGLPTRLKRWCCKLIKEAGGTGRIKLMGIRWEESASRKSRCMIETARNDNTTKYLHPIICWSNTEVFEYYSITKIPIIALYKQGFKRVGCIGCPQDTRKHRLETLARYPKTAIAWRLFADRYFEQYPETPSIKLLATKDNYWNWWLSGKSVKAYLNEQQSKF
jgi:phosphoadenosine phosphosulfate reductase